MIEYVRRLGAKRGIVLRNRGDRGLERLLSELFRAMRDAFVEQRARIGFLGARLGALRDQPGKVVERKHFIHSDNAVIALCRSKGQFVEGRSGRLRSVRPARPTRGAFFRACRGDRRRASAWISLRLFARLMTFFGKAESQIWRNVEHFPKLRIRSSY